MEIEATRLETDEEVRQALLKHRPAVRPGVAAHRDPAPPDDAPPLFRPTERPATPVLVVFDDGAEDGETIRIRKDHFTIGRTEGDLIIPNDAQMSGRHAELRRGASKDKHRWHLVDLKSTNGTYVRIGHAVLDHGQEFIVGRTRFRFERPRSGKAAAPRPASPADHGTLLWRGGTTDANAPSLVQVNADGGGPRVLVTQKELWLGRDGAYCQLVVHDDPFVSARHARIRQDGDRWTLENNKSPNGVWLRIDRLPLSGTCRFLLGEQQFMIRIPS